MSQVETQKQINPQIKTDVSGYFTVTFHVTERKTRKYQREKGFVVAYYLSPGTLRIVHEAIGSTREEAVTNLGNALDQAIDTEWGTK